MYLRMYVYMNIPESQAAARSATRGTDHLSGVERWSVPHLNTLKRACQKPPATTGKCLTCHTQQMLGVALEGACACDSEGTAAHKHTHADNSPTDPGTRYPGQHTSARRRRRRRLASASASVRVRSGRSGSVITGVLMLRAAVMNSSRRRGMPRVTFASPRPALTQCTRLAMQTMQSELAGACGRCPA